MRGPTTPAMRRPMRVDPVAEMSGMRVSASMRSPTSATGPMTRPKMPGKPCSAATRSAMCLHGERRTAAPCATASRPPVSPQTAAIAAFHAHTATGKLNAVITPTTPSGCHCSYMRCDGRSLCMDRP